MVKPSHNLPLLGLAEDFTSFIHHLPVSSFKWLIVRDFNYHLDIRNNPNTLNPLNLHQPVTMPTHDLSHILDLVIATPEELYIHTLITNFSVPSDNRAVLFNLNFYDIINRSLQKSVISQALQNTFSS